MINSLDIKNFTTFSKAKLKFGKHLNVIVGENGTGKTHLLKLAYALLAASAEEGRKPGGSNPTKAVLQPKLAEKLVGVFRPESLGRLASRSRGTTRCEIDIQFRPEKLDVALSFTTKSKAEVKIDRLPRAWSEISPAYLPTRELLTIYPGFVSVYEQHYLEFEETWRDTCLLLGAPLKRGVKEARVEELLKPLEAAMGGRIELDKSGRFYLVSSAGRMEMPLVAEGLRKLAMLARLVATGTLLDQGCLFWDEPEANLNARLVKRIASTIVALSESGIQIFIATHSLFLLRELEVLLSQTKLDARFFGLHFGESGVDVMQGKSMDDVGDIVALDEELEQSDRYLAHEASS